MIRAATTGALDFAQADPRDKWWWRKLRWILDELENTAVTTGLEAQHRHWVTVFSNSALTDESFGDAQKQSQEALGNLMGSLLPWRADEFKQSGKSGSAEEAIEEFREIYGYPGEERYESMLAETLAAFKAMED